MPRSAEGLEALKAKHQWWMSTRELHESNAEGPFLVDPDRFAVRFAMDATNRQTGERMRGTEVGIYTIKDGKIVRGEFFWLVN
jgi:ketosteroid isomerase-like protein